MMLLITAIALLILILIIIRHTSILFISPSVIFVGLFFGGILICLINPEWEFDISAKTSILIIGACIIFTLGQFFVKFVKFPKVIFNKKNRYKYSYCKIRTNLYYILVIIQIICCFIFTSFIIHIGGGLNGGMFSKARTWMIYNQLPMLVGHSQLISKTIALGCAYVYFTQVKDLYRSKYLIPVYIYIIIEIFSTSRSGLIYFLGYSMTIYVSTIQNSKRDIKKIIKTFFKYAIIVIALFLGLGLLTGKTKKIGIWNSIATYFGGSIYAFDWYVDNYSQFSSPTWGYNTLTIINSVKQFLGLKVAKQNMYYFPFITIPANVNDNLQRVTNLYTCICKPMCDFGIWGMILFFFALGMFYGVLYYKIIKIKTINPREVVLLYPGVIYFGYVMMPVFCAEAEYVFGSFLFSPMALYQYIYIYIFIKIFFRRYNNNLHE